ncbi:hypothetical protein FOC1_g10000941 [Fusarium oxysporum f. sp. cubense race 1]|uniref:Uncharacterized protein n=1 Tax=Fusarium oxysporum f. sp. cubense (strain race 1) TaxID=1229664 RepID=N4TUT3_FUSC1|nr:hypothetical protein FOC1_g10000941 [Fusarium oxysporum f. sp. cubense race 1]
MPTILEVLTGRNVSINSDSVISGTNTTVRTNFQPEDWTPWRDFNYSTITHIFHAELQKPYRVEKGPKPLEKELIISDERTLETLFFKFLIPTVNYALNGQPGQAFLGEGSRCSDDADWSTLSDQWFDDRGYFNLLPGDTKLDAKWRPNMLSDNFNEWQKVVSQVATYMARNYTRYGFILTDTKLVVLRLTRERIDAGIAMSRPQRTTATNFIHQRHSSDISMASTSISGSSYSNSDPENWAYCNSEYAVIDWNANGPRLTVKLALWALARMATSGDRHIDYSYPDLDTWRWADGCFVHNSSGVIKTKLSKHDVYQEAGTTSENTSINIAGGSTQNESEQNNYPQSQYDEENAGETDQPGYHRGDLPIHMSGNPTFDYQSQDLPPRQDDEDDDADNNGDDNDDDDDARTEVGSSHQRRKHSRRSRIAVPIRTHRKGGGFYYVNARGEKIDTYKENWTMVKDGYELEGRKHKYCCLYCAVVLGENVFYETWLFIIEMRALLGFISLDSFI